MKASKKTEKTVKFIDNPTRDNKDAKKTLKERMLKITAGKTPHLILIQLVKYK